MLIVLLFEQTKTIKNRSGLVNFFEKPLPNSLVVQKLWRVFWRVAGSQPTHPGDVKNAEQLEWRQTYWERYQCSKKVTDRQCDQIAKRISKNLTIYKIKKSAQQLFFAKAGFLFWQIVNQLSKNWQRQHLKFCQSGRMLPKMVTLMPTLFFSYGDHSMLKNSQQDFFEKNVTKWTNKLDQQGIEKVD